MNTTAHVVLNGLALGRGRLRPDWLPVTLGAVLPDLPMMGFYAYQRLVLAAPERLIWSERYFAPSWQAVFDLFNSLPLLALAAALAWQLGSRSGVALTVSMLLHALCDLPLHHADAHAHLFPFSDWHFRSPLSYWDPARGGRVFAALELAGVVAGGLVLARPSSPRPWRLVAAIAVVGHLAFGAFAWATWAS